MQSSGSQIQHPEALVASHLFLDSSETCASFKAFWLSPHPPLEERIRRISGILLRRADREEAFPPLPVTPFAEDNHLPILAANPHAEMPVPAIPPVVVPTTSLPEEITPASLNQAQSLLASLPETLREQTHTFIGATGILGGLLFARQSAIRAQQEKLLISGELPTAQELYQWLAAQPEHGACYRLVWFDLILPTLREAKATERQQLLVLAKDLIRADGRVSPTEFALYSLLRGALLPPSEHRVKRRELRLEQLDKDISDLLALLTYAGHEDAETTQATYREAIACSPASTQRPLPAKSELSLNKIAEALSHLALAAPPYREKLLDACKVAIQHDGKITPVENELLRAFTQSLDCPAPLIV